MNINPNNGPTDPGGAAPSSPQAGTHTPRLASPSAQSTHARHNIVNNVTAGRVPSPAELGRRPTPNIALMHFQSNLSTIEASMAGGNPIPEAVFEQAQEMLRGLPDLSQETATTLRNRLNDLSRHTRHLRENLHHHLIRAAQERVASQRATQGNESSAVYVLSSPSGPHALLVSPSGWYTTPWQLPTVGAGAHHSFIYHAPTGPTLTQPPINTDISDGQQPHIDASETVQARQQMPQHADPAQVAQVQQQQQANQARDLIRILLPLGGHLWLLIRLFGFVYFFTAGAGWRRTILLGLIASLVFIAQTGIFRPVIHGLWDPIRRHAEGLVPLAAQERPRAAGGTGENADGAGTQLVNREATPQEAAERLLQERERRDLSLVRQSFRRVERAVALFVASLVPGVGERHIAAREAAEAARQAEARASDEQRRRDEEEIRERHEGSSAPDNAGLDGNEQAATEGSSGQEQSHAAQPQLIEV